MCHLTEASAIGGCDTLDRTVGTVDIVFLIHGYITVLISVLSSDLSVSKELVDPLFRCYETALSVGCGIAVAPCNQGDLLDTTLVYTILEI